MQSLHEVRWRHDRDNDSNQSLVPLQQAFPPSQQAEEMEIHLCSNELEHLLAQSDTPPSHESGRGVQKLPRDKPSQALVTNERAFRHESKGARQ